MNKLETKHVIAQLADHFMMQSRDVRLTVNGQTQDHAQSLRNGVYAMYFRIDFDMENYGYEKDGRTRRQEWCRRYRSIIHVVITQRHNVFVCETQGGNKPSLDMFVNASNHDSCWRDDGLNILNEVAWKAYEHCYGFMPDKHRPIPLAAHSFVQFNDWHWGHTPFEIVKVKGDYNKANDYRWSLTGMKKMEFKLNIEDSEASNECA